MDFSQFDFVNFTGHLDLAQVLLYAFWLFLGALIFHLQAEARREGFPVETDDTGQVASGMLFMPSPKTFLLPHGHGEVTVPNYAREGRELALESSEGWAGSPKEPTGANPLLDGVGPGSYAMRADIPDAMDSGAVKIQPMSKIKGYAIPDGDPNPIGGNVIGVDGEAGGKVVDAWIDQAESVIRYYEIEVAGSSPAKTVLMPTNFAVVRTEPDTHLYVHAITGAQFADVPGTAKPDQITMLEEEKVMGYYGAGYFYATEGRAEPLL